MLEMFYTPPKMVEKGPMQVKFQITVTRVKYYNILLD